MKINRTCNIQREQYIAEATRKRPLAKNILLRRDSVCDLFQVLGTIILIGY